MKKLFRATRSLWRNKSGQDLVEYALLGGFVAVAAGAIFPTSLMPAVFGIFDRLATIFSLAANQGS